MSSLVWVSKFWTLRVETSELQFNESDKSSFSVDLISKYSLHLLPKYMFRPTQSKAIVYGAPTRPLSAPRNSVLLPPRYGVEYIVHWNKDLFCNDYILTKKNLYIYSTQLRHHQENTKLYVYIHYYLTFNKK